MTLLNPSKIRLDCENSGWVLIKNEVAMEEVLKNEFKTSTEIVKLSNKFRTVFASLIVADSVEWSKDRRINMVRKEIIMWSKIAKKT